MRPLVICSLVLMTLQIFSCGGGGSALSTDGNNDSNTDDTGNSSEITDSEDNGNNGSSDNPDSGETALGGTQTQPNILLIITDDQGLDSSAQYNLSNDLPNTPVIDSLAHTGITYENVWATPSCTTTRAALLTGKHGVNNGVTTTPGRLSNDVGTIQAYLQNTEYKSSVFGKWHVDGGNPDPNHPALLGVDHYSGNLNNLTDYYNWETTVNGIEMQTTQYHTSALVDYAIEWIEGQQAPWFTWIAFSAPHSPFHQPPAEYNTRNLSGTDADIEANRREYFLAAIETLDAEIGRLLNSMDATTRENTIVMFVGDNGTPRTVIDRSVYVAPNHGKGSLFEGGVRVPLVISGAGVTRTNVRETGLVSIVDFYSTIANLSGTTDEYNIRDGYSLVPSLSNSNAIGRNYLYTEFVSDDALGNGWTVRSSTHKYIAYADGSEALYDLISDPDETNNIIGSDSNGGNIAQELASFGLSARGESSEPEEVSGEKIDITNRYLDNSSPSCADHANSYLAAATDAGTGTQYNAALNVVVIGEQCVFNTNVTPNHTFNDGAFSFPNPFSQQDSEYRVPLVPSLADTVTPLSLRYDDAIMLNGVKVDLLAAGCFGVGNGRVGCNDDNHPWRYDPMYELNGFRVDQHNAHTQPNGAYHYHGDPMALFDRNGTQASPVIGFAADGFPIFGSYIEDNGNVRAVRSSFQLKSGSRPDGTASPGGTYDGTYRDDYEFIDGSGDLDECNGMVANGAYGYYVTDSYPHVMACLKGTVDPSFRK